MGAQRKKPKPKPKANKSKNNWLALFGRLSLAFCTLFFTFNGVTELQKCYFPSASGTRNVERLESDRIGGVYFLFGVFFNGFMGTQSIKWLWWLGRPYQRSVERFLFIFSHELCLCRYAVSLFRFSPLSLLFPRLFFRFSFFVAARRR